MFLQTNRILGLHEASISMLCDLLMYSDLKQLHLHHVNKHSSTFLLTLIQKHLTAYRVYTIPKPHRTAHSFSVLSQLNLLYSQPFPTSPLHFPSILPLPLHSVSSLMTTYTH